MPESRNLQLAALFSMTGLLYTHYSGENKLRQVRESKGDTLQEALASAALFAEECRKQNPALLPVEVVRILNNNPEYVRERELIECILRIFGYTQPGENLWLLSPFSTIRLDGCRSPAEHYLKPCKLSLNAEAGFPILRTAPPDAEENGAYKKLVRGFLEELPKVANTRGLYALFDKYFHGVGCLAGTVPLATHARLLAAVTFCVQRSLSASKEQGSAPPRANVQNPAVDALSLTFIMGDLSGIQDFIFNVTSEKAARKLKSRSILVQFMSELAAQIVLDTYGLDYSCLLTASGGNFSILAPANSEKKLADCRRVIDKALADSGLSLALACCDATVSELAHQAGTVRERAGRFCQAQKYRPFSSLEWEEVFVPFPQRVAEANLSELVKKLQQREKYRTYKAPRSRREYDKMAEWEQLLHRFGYRIDLDYPQPEGTVVINTTKFLKQGDSFHFMVKELPVWTQEALDAYLPYFRKKYEKQLAEGTLDEEDLEINRHIEFSHLGNFAEMETGSDNLAILKMDVDNLGRLFQKGLGKDVSVSNFIGLAGRLQWFFEGFLTTIIGQEQYRNRIYTVFSGGDDTFLLGPWNTVFDLAFELREQFRTFACKHRCVTLSASLTLVPPKFSVVRFAPLAETALEKAKKHGPPGSDPEKNAVNVFGETLSWECFRYARVIKEKLVRLIEEHGAGRDILFKTMRLCKVLSQIIQDNEKAKPVANTARPFIPLPVWRFSFYLRDIIVAKPQTEQDRVRNDIARRLNDHFERIVLRACARPYAVNPMLFAVAARWAELAHKPGETESTTNNSTE